MRRRIILFLVSVIFFLIISIAVASQFGDGWQVGYESGFKAGRSYQIGRSDAIDGVTMKSRVERESIKDIFETLNEDLKLLLHVSYETGYKEGLNSLNKITPKQNLKMYPSLKY